MAAMDEYKKYLKIALPGILFIAGVIFYVTSMSRTAEKDYLQAKVSYSKGEDLGYFLKRYPELEGRYGMELQQRALAEGKMVKSSLSDGSPFAFYARTSETISAKKYKQALQEALDLKEQLKISEYYGETLDAYNTLRIAMLQRELGDLKAEKKALKELKDTGKVSKLPHFVDGRFSLTDYVDERLSI